jgi:hypothetical protein
MIEHLYRFRPLEWLSDGGELRNQEIYFAEPEQLNDPMEGFRDVFWKGDAIVWKNFLRHYLLCLDNAFSQLLICGEAQPFGWKEIPVFNHGDMSLGTPHKEMEDEILGVFFGEQSVATLIAALAARSLPIRAMNLRPTFATSTHSPFMLFVKHTNVASSCLSFLTLM